MIWIGDWKLDPAVRLLSRGESKERLEPRMLDVLMVLVEHAGQPVLRRDLERTVWSGAAVGTELLNRTVWKLRRCLGDDAASPMYIETIPRVGYRLIAPVTRVPPEAGSPVRRTPPRWPAWSAAATIAAIGGTILFAGRTRLPATGGEAWRIAPLTASPGYEAAPALSPDGRQVAFQRYDREAAHPTWDVAVMELASGRVHIIAGDRDLDEYGPVWAPTGDSIAFIRQGSGCEIVVRAMTGGSAPPLACAPDQSHEIVWQADGSLILASSGSGQTLGLLRIDRSTGTLNALTHPAAEFDGDRHPRPSPDGHRLAFVRQRTQGVSDIYLLDTVTPREPRRLTFDHRRIGDLAWTNDGAALVFSSTRGGDSRLWRLTIDGGALTPMPMSGRNASRISIGRGNSLVYEEYFGDSDIFAFDPATGESRSWTGSSRSEWAVTVSPDGRSVAFLSDRTGAPEVWAMSTDSGEPRRLTRLDGAQVDPPRFSADGRRLAFAAALGDNFDIYTVGIGGGAVERLTRDPVDERAPAWWGDSLVYTANRTGTPELWILSRDGQRTHRLTSGGVAAARPAVDGHTLFFSRPDEPGLWEYRDGASPVLVWPDLQPTDWANWTPTKDGVLYFRVEGTAEPRLERFDPGSGAVERLAVVTAEAPSWAGVAVMPGGRILFTRIVRSESDLWIATGPGPQMNGR